MKTKIMQQALAYFAGENAMVGTKTTHYAALQKGRKLSVKTRQYCHVNIATSANSVTAKSVNSVE